MMWSLRDILYYFWDEGGSSSSPNFEFVTHFRSQQSYSQEAKEAVIAQRRINKNHNFHF